MAAIYFLCDTSKASFAAAITASRGEHTRNYRNARLSVAQDPARTRAVIKVYAASRGLINSDTVLQKFDDTERRALHTAMAVIAPLEEWSNPV